MCYLSAYSRRLFKSYHCYVLFLPLEKFFKYYEKVHLHIFLKKNFLVSKYKKQMCYKGNKVRLQKLIKFRLSG